jgi:hypothetical protein
MKKIKVLFIITIIALINLIFTGKIFAQVKDIQLSIGGDSVENGAVSIQTNDGGYALLGSTMSYGAGNYDVYVVKLDSMSNIQWTKTIGGSGDDEGKSIVQTSDSGYAITGYTNSYGAGEYDVYVIKLDKLGNLKWTKTIGGIKNDFGYSIIQAKDGNLLVAGNSSSFNGGYVYIIKLDNLGNVIWTKGIQGNNWITSSIIQARDGGYAVGGSVRNSGTSYNFLVLKLDSSGDPLWNKQINSRLYEADQDNAYSIVQTSDGGYALGGEIKTPSDMYEGYIVKVDTVGNMIWNDIITDTTDDVFYNSMTQTKDGGLALAGYNSSSATIVKLDASGNYKWAESIGNSGGDDCFSIIQTRDGGYGLAGTTHLLGIRLNNLTFVKLDSSFNTCDVAPMTNGISHYDTLVHSTVTTISDSGSVGSGGTTSSGGIRTSICNVFACIAYKPVICFVTSDTLSHHDEVIWDRTGIDTTVIDSFVIYRGITTSLYAKVGEVSVHNYTEFIDTGSNPNLTPYFYKLGVVDSCHMDTAISPYHESVLLQASIGTGNKINLSWNAYQGAIVNYYRILRDDSGLGHWHVLDSVPGGVTSYTDLTPPLNPGIRYMLNTNWSITCTPYLLVHNRNHLTHNYNLTTVNESYSNINNIYPTGVQRYNELSGFKVYPNPASNILYLDLPFSSLNSTLSIQITDITGRILLTNDFQLTTNAYPIDISTLSSGLYFIQLISNSGTEVKKFIKE